MTNKSINIALQHKALSEIKNVEALTSFVTVKSEEAKANLEALKTEAQVSAQTVSKRLISVNLNHLMASYGLQ